MGVGDVVWVGVGSGVGVGIGSGVLVTEGLISGENYERKKNELLDKHF